jgi:hypothetical protein
MPVQDNFTFTAQDPLVTTYLTATEIKAVKYWQQSGAYELEFHDGHSIGRPIYVRPVGNTDRSNVPKLDTLNKSASDYPSVSSLANGMKLRKELKNRDQADLEAVISKSWDSLALLAQRYWTA